MIRALRSRWNTFRGSGDAAVTVPPMDGALRPNRLLEDAPLLCAIDAPDDLSVQNDHLLVSSGTEIHRIEPDGRAHLIKSFPAAVTALAASPAGVLAVGLANGTIEIVGGNSNGLVLAELGANTANCTTALCFDGEGHLLVAQGSAARPVSDWKRDLMERQATGSVHRVELGSNKREMLADRLAWPFGVARSSDGRIIVSESWRHRLVALGAGKAAEPVLSDLPGYPARLHRDSATGDTWLALFAPRNQIIEFVQREPEFLRRMMQDVDPAYWAAPSIMPSATFLEPLQGGAQKHLGMLKPWAPTRSYGLVVRLSPDFRPLQSFHSRADGTRHGVFTCLRVGDRLVAASKGGNAIIDLAGNAVAQPIESVEFA